jgi:dipeptidyl aminopeptidase/acylaminoacyl peptidase
VAPAALRAQTAARPLDHDDFERWQAIRGQSLSPDGGWAAYELAAPGVMAHVRIQALPTGPALEIPRGRTPLFTSDSRYLAVTVDARPTAGGSAPDTLALIDLDRLRAGAAGAIERTGGVVRIEAAEKAPRIVYRLNQGSGSVLVVRDLATGAENRVRGAGEFRLARDGHVLWFVRENARGEGEGVFRMDPATGTVTAAFVQSGAYAGLTMSSDGRRLAFLTAPELDATPVWRLQVATEGGATRALVSDGAPELRPGWRVRSDEPIRFSASGQRLFFAAAPPAAQPAASDADQDVHVDVWSWSDPYLQPMQLAQLKEERERSYRWVAHLAEGTVVQLEEPGSPRLQEPRSGDEPALVAVTDEPYRRLLSWDARYVDVYLVDAATGNRTRAIERVRNGVTASPTGRWLAWWDGDGRAWRSLEVATGRAASMTAAVPYPVHDESHDRPGPPDPYGLAAWTTGDARALVYDGNDVWSVDPAGVQPAVAVTDGVGRRDGVRLRVSLEGPTGEIAADAPLLLSALDLKTREAGFFADRLGAEVEPKRLLMSPHRYGEPVRARLGNRVLFTRESFSEYPDLWTADGSLAGLARVSSANPQQAEFRWGTEELVGWSGADGKRIQGILYKPQGFDPARKYPLVVNLYERATDDFHRYHDPAPGSSSINRSFYVSRGYLVFAPDIAYRVGEPGQSVEDAVVPGVQALIASGIVDPTRIGVQGHSWGGWEVAYLLTRTKLFAAAIAGAPVANMTSAYGGVRWGSGMSRMFQYEQEQSRIGATLWQAPDRFIDNSPVFGADKIETPLLVLHNDEDNAVPWEQGIELFTALRRLSKAVWMVNYNGELHALSRAGNRRDWAIRMQQFLDHYLMAERAPVWMVDGIPANQKGRTLGLGLVEEATRPPTDR